MRAEVVKTLAHFLDAIPYQVEAWDKSVIDHLAANPDQLRAFHAGSADTKWGIYSSIRYPRPAALAR